MRAFLFALALAALTACGPKPASQGPTPTLDPDPAPGDGATGDGGDATPPAGGATEIPAETEAHAIAAIELFEDLAAAAESGNGDCPLIVFKMRGVADGPHGEALHEADQDPNMSREIAEELMQRHGERLDRATTRLSQALQACPNTPEIDAIFQQIGLATGGGDAPPVE
ncbi:MAG: hypothetical protein H6708_04720 [Kofleriaceae bacterium]|nr:hypothetical protein [Myxococcales bacterium]MCB9559690.1 hypothetical protein [Kofleriaceae bacterium]